METHPGSQEPRNATKSQRTTNITHETYWEGKTGGGYLCSGEKQQRTEQNIGFMLDFLQGGGSFQGDLGLIGGIM